MLESALLAIESALIVARIRRTDWLMLPSPSEEAVRQAEAEGLTLLEADNTTGYTCVYFNSGNCKTRPYHAKVRRGGKDVSLGCFATAEEAALAYARTPEGRAAVAAAAAPPAPPPMTAEEAVQRAESEGLTLLKADNPAGYKGVDFNRSCKTKPYHVKVWRGGKDVSLGSFATLKH